MVLRIGLRAVGYVEIIGAGMLFPSSRISAFPVALVVGVREGWPGHPALAAQCLIKPRGEKR